MNEERTILYDRCAAVAALNHVDGFDPKAYMRDLSTEDGVGKYLDVKYRRLWFRLCHPEGKIKKFFHTLNEQVAICEARVYLNKNDPEDQYVGSGIAQRFFKPEERLGDKFVENAETAAVGRALSEAGFGSQFSDCDATEPADPAVVDAPVTPGIPSPAPAVMPAMPGAGAAYMAAPTVTPAAVPAAMPAAAPPATVPAAIPAPMPAARPMAAPPAALTFEQAYAAMTLEQAKATVIDCGCYKGQTLGQLAMSKPQALDWYVNSYKGKNVGLRAAAKFLMDMAAANR